MELVGKAPLACQQPCAEALCQHNPPGIGNDIEVALAILLKYFFEINIFYHFTCG